MPDPKFWALAGASLAYFVLAAKVHGRHIRLERELEGHMDVAFGPSASNPPWVEALWRKDRLRFWPTAAALATLGAMLAFAPVASLGPRAEPSAWAGLAAILWAPSLAFLSNGAQSHARFRKALGRKPAAWARAAARATRLYWAAAAAGGGALAALTLA